MNFLQVHNRELETGANDDGGAGLIALEIMPISSRITHSALERQVMIREILQIVQYHRGSRFVLVSHSYGFIIAAHLLNSDLFDTLIGPMVFIDPVAFLLHLPDVTQSFTLRQHEPMNTCYDTLGVKALVLPIHCQHNLVRGSWDIE